MFHDGRYHKPLEEIRKRSEEDKAVLQREEKEMKRKVNRLQEEELTAANAKASLEEISKRSEEDKAVWQRATSCSIQRRQTKKRLSDGNKEQNSVLMPAAQPPNKKQKQNVQGKACDAEFFCAQLAGLTC